MKRSVRWRPSVGRSIRWRLSVYQVAIVSVAMVAVAVAVENSVHHYYLRRLEQHLWQQAALVQRVVKPDLIAGAPARQVGLTVSSLARSAPMMPRITIVGPGGGVLADSQPLPGQPPNLGHRPELRVFLRAMVPPGHTVVPPVRPFARAIRDDGMHVAVPIVYQLQLLGIARVSLSLADLRQQLWSLRGLILGTVLLATVAAVAVTLYVTGSITGPISEVTEVAQRMAEGDLTRRVIANPDDEIGRLTRSFNSMAARIQATMGELDRERQKMARVFTQMADGLVVVDTDTRVVLMNPAAETMVGALAEAAIGQPLGQVAALQELTRVVDEVMATGREARDDLLREEPRQEVIGVYAAPVLGNPEAPPGVMLVLHDRTEVWRTERLRREFVANASHELRTPIAAVKMMADTLLEGAQEDPDVRRRFLRLLAREADRLSNLASDLLDLSQMEAGQWRVEIEPFALREVADPVLAKLAVVAGERGQRLTGECPDSLEVLGDKRALTQVLTNLVENAIKYTPEGGRVWMTAERQGERVQIAVHDTGIGISAPHLERIFQRFYRVDKARSREQGGTGLGLAIVRHLVEAQNGTVEARSGVGTGSTFIVTLPSPGPPPTREAA
ncbi:MAG: HAMP domain-containing protein [Armatimonadetes bacterium]|nr:HAMP domain-containing protein [Armatimonadota bacterium]